MEHEGPPLAALLGECATTFAAVRTALELIAPHLDEDDARLLRALADTCQLRLDQISRSFGGAGADGPSNAPATPGDGSSWCSPGAAPPNPFAGLGVA